MWQNVDSQINNLRTMYLHSAFSNILEKKYSCDVVFGAFFFFKTRNLTGQNVSNCKQYVNDSF